MRKLKLFLTLLMLMCIGVTQMWATDYQLVTSTDDLVVGANYVIGTSDGSFIATTSNNNNRKITSATITNNVVTATDAMMVFTLGGTSSGWTLYAGNYADGAGYLNATSTTGSNNVKIVATLDKYAYFSIAITDAGVATVTCTGKTSRHILYKNGTTCFSCYSNQTTAQYVKPGLYKEVSEKTLSSIAVKTAPTKVVYTEGDNFDPTGLVITGTYSDASTSDIAYAGNESDFSFSPTTSAALATTDTKVTITYGGKSVDQTIIVNAAACANPVAVAKGAETNGTYTLSATEVCGDGDGGVVFITDITPAAGYELDDITATAGSVDKANKKVTGITAATTITVTFKELPKYKVSFNVGGSAASQADITEESYGAGITLPAGPTPTCSADGWEFAGWAAATVASTTTVPTLYAAASTYHPTENCTLYAVYKKTEGQEETWNQITSAPEDWNGEYVLARNGYAMTSDLSSGEFQGASVTITDGKVVNPTDKMIWTFAKNGENAQYSLQNKSTGTYANITGTSSKNAGLSQNAVWFTLSYSTSSVWQINSVTNNTRCFAYYSNNFRTYANSTATNGVDLYKKSGGSTTTYASAPTCPTCEKLGTPVVSVPAEYLKYNSAKLTWEAVENADKYVVKFNGVDQDATSNTYFEATGLTAETQYSYQVKALAEEGQDDYCDGVFSASENFTTAEMPAAVLVLSENGVSRNLPGTHHLNDVISLPTEVVTGMDDKTLVGWSSVTIETPTDTKPTENFFAPGASYTLSAESQTLYAVYASGEDGGEVWNLATSVEAGDVIVFSTHAGYTTNTMKTAGGFNNQTYLSWTGSTYNEDKTQITELAEGTIQFTIGGNANDGWTLANGGQYLYMSGDKKIALKEAATTWSISFDGNMASVSQVYNTSTYTMYCNYSASRFNCYTSSNNMVEVSLYKRVVIADTRSGYTTKGCEKHAISIADNIENGSVEADLTEACEGATVTITFTPAGSHHLESWSVNGTAQDITKNTFAMLGEAVTVSATFAHDACQNLAKPALDGEIAKTYNSATIAWAEVANASSYLVSVIKKDAEEPIFSGSVTELSKALSKLEAETQYNYSIMAVGDGVDYCAEGNTVLEGNFITSALPEVKLTLMVGGVEDTDLSGDHAILTPFNLPSTASVDNCPKVFVGWSADANRTTAPEYAPGAEFTFADEIPATLYAVFAKEGAGSPVTYSIDFEADAATYTNWVFDNMTSNYTTSGITAHGGSKIGSTGGKATASVTTAAKIANPTSITSYVSKQSTNTTASSWKVEVSADGSEWTQVGDAQSATSMAKGEWVEVTRDLSEYSDVYVRVYYGSNTAVRLIDDLVLSAIGPKTYSEYSTECEACTTVTLVKAGEDQEKGNTFALKVGDDVENVQTCEAASVTIEPTVATGYEVSFAISELEGASLSENTISLAANAEGELTVTATFTQKNYVVTLAQNPAAGATLVGGKEDAHFGETINLSTDVPTGYEFINWTSESVEITNATSATGASFTMPDADVTVTANFGKVYTVSFNAGSDPITETAIGAGVELPAGPAPSEACVAAGWAFAGWAEAAVASETTDAQTLYTGEYHPTSDITLYAVYSRTESGSAPAETNYVKTAFADLVSGDAIVITNDEYAMSHSNKGSKGQPNAVEVTVAEDVITSSVEGLVWDITKGEENFSLAVHGGTDNLYCTSDNNGVRVGENANISFQIDDDYLYHVDEDRYLGVYQSTDWRCYTSINSNISGQTLAFYKAVSTASSTTYYWSAPECCTPLNVTIAGNIEHGTVVANPTSACADATITVSLTPAEGYELTAWTVDGTEQALNATTFTMPNNAVEVSATFSEIVTPPAEATLKLMENGHEVVFAGSHNVDDVVTLPNELSDAAHACEGKVLKGWSAVEITTPVAAKPSEYFYELGDSYTIASEEDVLYAVFAEEVPGATNTTNITYSGATANMAVNTNEATKFGLDADQWSVVGAKGGNSNNVGLNKAGDIRLYYHANGGNTLTITAPQTITSVGLTFSETYNNVWVKVGEETVALSDGVYPINATSFVIGNANTSNVQVRISKIEVNFTAEGTVANYATSCVEPLADPTFNVDGGEYTSAQTIELSAEEGTIYYTLDGKTPTSASTEYTAAIELNDCGTYTIKAIAISATNHSEVVSTTYTLNIPLSPNSELIPYTPTEARTVIDGSCYDGETVMYVKGVVKSCTEFNSNFGNYDVVVRNIGDETPEAPTFTYYHMYAASGKVKFTADEEIAAGDTIIAAGVLTLYGTTYEFANNTCYMVEHKKYLAPKEHIANTQDDPYTIAQAIGFCDNAIAYYLTDEVYLQGVVKSISGTTNINIFLHDANVDNEFELYHVNLNENEVGVNDTIIAKGTILKYNTTTYEMSEGGLVVEVKKYVAPVVPEFTVSPTAVAFGNVEQGAEVEAIEVSVELTAIENATVTLAGTGASAFNISTETLTEDGIITVTANSNVEVGEYAATITLHDEAAAAEDVVINVTMNVTEVETRKVATITSFSSVSGDLNPSDITYAGYQGGAQNAPNASNKDNELRLYKYQTSTDFGGYVTIKAKTGCTIDQVVITVGGNAKVGFSKNDAAIPTKESTPISLSTSNPFDSGTGLDADSIRVVNIDESNQFKIKTITVYYEGEPLAVHHYILGGTYETTFEQNTEFSYEGLTVTAAYDEQETITEAVTGFTVEADLSTAGDKKAEVMLNSVKIAEYDITVNPGKANPNLAYMPAEQIVPATEVGTWVAPTLNNTLHVAPITYSSSKQAVATVDENGVIALAGGYGTAVITASFAGDDDNIASEATYTITVQEPVNKIAGKWMVAGAEDIKPGIKVIVVGEKSGTKYAMGAHNTNNRAAVAAQSIVADTLYAAEGTKTFILVDAGEGLYAFQANNGMYLYAASNSSNQMKEQATLNDNGKWSIAIANDGEATIQAQGSNSRNLMSMNPNGNNNPLFSCYKDEQSAIKLYVNRNQIDGSDDPANPAEVAINDNVVEDEIVANGNVVVTVNTDNIEEPKSYIAQNGATIIITGTNPVAKNVVVEDGSRIEASVPTTTPNVYFATTMGSTQTPGTASELGSVTNITLATGGEIIYDLTLGTSMAGIQADPSQWHAFTLPFAVSATEGIYDAETGAKLYNEVNYAIMDYHGDIRANGLYGWKKYSGILQPGVFYIMTVDGNTKTFRFKATQTGQMTQTTSMGYKAYNGSGDPSKDFGWNGIGNPSWVSGTVTVNVQVLDPYSYTYQPLTSSTNITVSTPFFYNAGGDGSTGSVVMQDAGTGANYAPARTPANEIKNVAVTFGNEVFRDKLYISASEDALNTYEQDKDLVRMIMSNTPKVAQIFGNAYGMKLSMVNAPMTNGQAEYSLTLYAPSAGEYSIAVPEMENADIYLTYEGSIIWNLSMSDYTNDFAKGNNEGYGLILVKKAPQVITGVDNAEANEAGVQKVIINDHVYILRDEQMYDVTGKMVK